MLRHHFHLAHIGETLLLQESYRLLHQNLGRGSSCGKTDGVHVVQPLRLDGAIVLDEVRVRAQVARDLDQPVRVGAVVGAHDQQQIALGGNVFHRRLAVLRRVTNVLRVRPLDVGEALAQRFDHVRGLVQAQRGLRQIGDAIRIGHVQVVHVFGRIHHLRHQRSFAQRADDFVVIAMSDQDERIAFAGKLHRLDVDLGHQRTGRVDHAQLAQLAGLRALREQRRARCR